MNDADLIAMVCEANLGYSALGNERFQAHGATFIRNRVTPRRYDSNDVALIRAQAADTPALLERVETEYAGMGHRQFVVDPLTPAAFQARLALEDGYRAGEILVQLLEGELQASPKSVEIREVVSEEDWAAYEELDAMWWQESATSEEVFGAYDREFHDELMANLRMKSPAVRRWFACVEGVPRAFFGSWPGENGIGVVEDLFCHAEYRNRGLATALIAHAVADARARSAGPVIINSEPRDTPKHIYARMGFRPLYVQRTYTKRLTGV